MTFEEALKLANSEEVKHRRVLKDKEHQLQCACVRWFNYEHQDLRGLLFAIPNGGKRDERTAAKLKAEGVVAGVADLMLAVPKNKGEYTQYHGLFIEMKTDDKSSKQRPSQKEFEGKVTMMRYRYVVIRTFEEFTNEINSYLHGKEETGN